MGAESDVVMASKPFGCMPWLLATGGQSSIHWARFRGTFKCPHGQLDARSTWPLLSNKNLRCAPCAQVMRVAEIAGLTSTNGTMAGARKASSQLVR